MCRFLATSLMGSCFYFFQEYIIHVDPVSQLGLNSDSVLGYSIGEIRRSTASETPELLPCGYLVGENTTISVTVKGNPALTEAGAPRNGGLCLGTWHRKPWPRFCLCIWLWIVCFPLHQLFLSKQAEQSLAFATTVGNK